MSSFDFSSIGSALADSELPEKGVDFSGKSLKLDTAEDALPIVAAIHTCKHLHYLTLTGNTLGVEAALAISEALKRHPELKIARFSDMFTGRMKTEIPPALSALGDGMIKAGARLSVLELSDNAFGPIGVEGLSKLLKSDVCSQLEELRLNNNGLGITGARLLAKALASRPRKLKVFIAGRNRLENEGAIELAKVFRNMGTLEEVAMPQNGIYHVGVAALSEAFERNPRLRCINLNDNTIGVLGATAIAAALPKLKNLKSINFGDCLLKSKGAIALAKGFKDNCILLESLDLSHNEIKQKACMEVVDAVTALPDATERLARVVLAGNSFGSSNNKKVMKEKLGPSAELSDGEESYEEESEGSESEQESSDEDSDAAPASIRNGDTEDSEDSAPEDSRHMSGDAITLDTTQDSEAPTTDSDALGKLVPVFIQTPTMENFNRLGPSASNLIENHILQEKKELSDYFTAFVEATFCVSGLSEDNPRAMEIAQELFAVMVRKASEDQTTAPWLFANTILWGLGLIKSENKECRIRWNTAGCYNALAKAMLKLKFPAVVSDTLRFFISSQLPKLPDKKVVMKHPQLYKMDAEAH